MWPPSEISACHQFPHNGDDDGDDDDDDVDGDDAAGDDEGVEKGLRQGSEAEQSSNHTVLQYCTMHPAYWMYTEYWILNTARYILNTEYWIILIL